MLQRMQQKVAASSYKLADELSVVIIYFFAMVLFRQNYTFSPLT